MLYATLVMLWNISRIYFIRPKATLFFSKFFPTFFFWCKTYSLSVTFIYKRFSFCYSMRTFFDFFMLLSFLLIRFIVAFCFLSNKEKMYTIPHESDLFYDIHNAINKHNRTHYLPSISNHFDIYFWVIQKFVL